MTDKAKIFDYFRAYIDEVNLKIDCCIERNAYFSQMKEEASGIHYDGSIDVHDGGFLEN